MNRIFGVRVGLSCQVVEGWTDAVVMGLGDRVVVDTGEGLYLGRIVFGPLRTEEELSEGENLYHIVRRLDGQDQAKLRDQARLEREAYNFCLTRIQARQMPMNLVAVERLFDASKMIFYFTAEGRVDFRALVKDLAGRFRCRVEMRQIGVRNETKILGGVGSCGRQLCCATFMKDFTPVSVKMAKEQNLSLNPNKISGLCGRLMCCLAYEFPVYMEQKKGMPKLGKRVITPLGEGKVIRQNVMAGRITVCVEGKETEFEAGQVRLAAPPPPPSKKTNSGRHNNRGKRE